MALIMKMTETERAAQRPWHIAFLYDIRIREKWAKQIRLGQTVVFDDVVLKIDRTTMEECRDNLEAVLTNCRASVPKSSLARSNAAGTLQIATDTAAAATAAIADTAPIPKQPSKRELKRKRRVFTYGRKCGAMKHRNPW